MYRHRRTPDRETGLKAPDDYRGVFVCLATAGLDEELAQRLAAASDMRNIPIHGYLDVDEETVWNALVELDDLRDFARVAEQAIEENGPGSEAQRPAPRL